MDDWIDRRFWVKNFAALSLIGFSVFIPCRFFFCGAIICGICYVLWIMQIRATTAVNRALNPGKRFHHSTVQPVFHLKIKRHSSSLIPRLQVKPVKRMPPIACVKPVRSQLNLTENQVENQPIKKSTTCSGISTIASNNAKTIDVAQNFEVAVEIGRLYSSLKTLTVVVTEINKKMDKNSNSEEQLNRISSHVELLTKDIAWEKIQKEALEMALIAKETDVTVLEQNFQGATSRLETMQKVCVNSSKQIRAQTAKQQLQIKDCFRTVTKLLDTVDCLRKGKNPNLGNLLNLERKQKDSQGPASTGQLSISSEKSVADVSQSLQELSLKLNKLQENLLDYFIVRIAEKISLK